MVRRSCPRPTTHHSRCRARRSGRLFEGSASVLHDSLQRLLARLPLSTDIFPGHEYTIMLLGMQTQSKPSRRVLEKLDEARLARARKLPTVPSKLEDELVCNPVRHIQMHAICYTADVAWMPHATRIPLLSGSRVRSGCKRGPRSSLCSAGASSDARAASLHGCLSGLCTVCCGGILARARSAGPPGGPRRCAPGLHAGRQTEHCDERKPEARECKSRDTYTPEASPPPR